MEINPNEDSVFLNFFQKVFFFDFNSKRVGVFNWLYFFFLFVHFWSVSFFFFFFVVGQFYFGLPLNERKEKPFKSQKNFKRHKNNE